MNKLGGRGQVNERVVQKSLDRLMKDHHGVAIVIAHRLTTVKNCDNIVVMDRGKKVGGCLARSMHGGSFSPPGCIDSGVNGFCLQYHLTNLISGCAYLTLYTLQVEEGTHEELMKIQIKKNKKTDAVKQGYYHNQWDTQMGEESFGAPEHMNDEQLAGKQKFLQKQADELGTARKQRVIDDQKWKDLTVQVGV
jgi:energy-coupling factor transporter ATP-binding protein EcfA2